MIDEEINDLIMDDFYMATKAAEVAKKDAERAKKDTNKSTS